MIENSSTRTKRITKNSIALYIRLFILLLIGLYTSRVILDVLGVEDFGIYNLVGGIIFIANFISNALALSIDRFLAYNIGLNNLKRLKKVFSMAVNIHIIIAIIILVVGETLGLWFVCTQLNIPPNRLLAAHVIYQSSIISFILYIISTPYNSDVIAHEKMDFFAFVGVLQGVLKLFIAIAIPFISCDKLVVYALLMIIPSLLYFILNWLYCNKYFKESKYTLIWSKNLFWEMSRFAGFSTFGNMATAVVYQGQSILLNLFYGPALNAVRGLTIQISNAVNSFTNGIYTAVNPQIIKSYAQKDIEYFEKLIFNSTIVGYNMLFTISLPIFLEIDVILDFWLKYVPPYTSIFVRLILINTLIYNFVTPSWMAIQATGNVAKIHVTTGSINLMNLLITYILWKFIKLEPYSIVIVNIAISSIMQIATIIIQKKQLNINIKRYLSKVTLPAIYSSFIAIIIPFSIYYNMELSIFRFFAVVFTSIACSLLSFYFIGISPGLRIYIKNWTMEKIIKNNNIK